MTFTIHLTILRKQFNRFIVASDKPLKGIQWSHAIGLFICVCVKGADPLAVAFMYPDTGNTISMAIEELLPVIGKYGGSVKVFSEPPDFQ